MTAAHHEERRRQLAEDRYGGVCECGDHAWTRLTKGFVVLVSPADADVLKEQPFCAALSRRGGVPYANHGVRDDEGRQRSVLLQHELLGDPPNGTETNFKNGNSLDCRRSNLEWGDHGLTRHRTPRPTKRVAEASRYIGVGRSNRNCITGGTWFAYISHAGKRFHLGSFPLTAEGEIAAARAHDDAAQKLYGEFAVANFPPRSVAALDAAATRMAVEKLQASSRRCNGAWEAIIEAKRRNVDVPDDGQPARFRLRERSTA